MEDNGRKDGGHYSIRALYYTLRALEAESKDELDQDLRKLLLELGTKLSTAIELDEGEEKINGEIKDRLVSAEDTITSIHSKYTRIWDSPSVVLDYLAAVDDVRLLAEDLDGMSFKNYRRMKEVVDQTHTILHIAMDRLQEELIHILAQTKQSSEEYVSLPVCEEESMFYESFDSVENVSCRASTSSDLEEDLMDLVRPDVIPHISSIAGRMFASGYSHEFCLTFIKFWRQSFHEYMTVLGLKQLSIAEVRKMEWNETNYRIRKWCHCVKSSVSTYLYGLKRLFDQVLGEYGNASSFYLVEATKASMSSIADFGQAVALGPHGPEWFFCLLKMYDALGTLMPDIEVLYPEEAGNSIKIEFFNLLSRLGASAKLVFSDFGRHIESDPSTIPTVNGGIHPLTKYVGNYMHCLSGYCDMLESLFGDRSLVASLLLSFTSKLETNLEAKSNLCNDPALKHIFLMNNTHYLVQKLRKSDIISYLGDDWIKGYICLYRKHSINYMRDTWNTILSVIQIGDNVEKASLKERCRDFATAFEDVYRRQTGWLVSDNILLEDLRISTTKTVILPYRSFVQKVTASIRDKHVKYSEQDVETYIFDLFGGSSKQLNHPRQR